MAELDLAGLRDDIQGETLLPSFADVERRAAHRRRRSRIARTAGVAGLVAAMIPVLGVGGFMVARSTGRNGVLTFSVAVDGQADRLPGPDRSGTDAMTHDLVAVDAMSTSGIYGLVDVCRDGQCSLQLISIDVTGAPGRTLRGGLLRSNPRERLSDVRLTVVNEGQVAVSGYVGEQPRPAVATVAVPTNPPSGSIPATRPVQVAPYAPIAAVTGTSGSQVPLAHQPPLEQPQLASSTAGWWVTGTDSRTGHIGVSVSRDLGSTWKTTTLPVVKPDVGVSLATGDGLNVYAVYGLAGAAVMTRSRDGGRTWSSPAALPIAVLGAFVGVYLAQDGSVVAWTCTGDRTTVVRSQDRGVSWSPLLGPRDGPIVAVPGGAFLALGATPEESLDGLHWLTATATYTPMIS